MGKLSFLGKHYKDAVPALGLLIHNHLDAAETGGGPQAVDKKPSVLMILTDLKELENRLLIKSYLH
ncbi:MAG: hypothetical protein AB2693_35125 [Candidatus Thiodiazotropha sp.]